MNTRPQIVSAPSLRLLALMALPCAATSFAQTNVNSTLASGGGTANFGNSTTWTAGVPNASTPAVMSGAFSQNLVLNILDSSGASVDYTVGDISFRDSTNTFRDLLLGNTTGGSLVLGNTNNSWTMASTGGGLFQLAANAKVTSTDSQTLTLSNNASTSYPITTTDMSGAGFRFNAGTTWASFNGTLELSNGAYYVNASNVLPAHANAKALTLGTGSNVAYLRLSSTFDQRVAALNGNAQSFVFSNNTSAVRTLTINGTQDGTFAGTVGSNGNASFSNPGLNIVKSGSGNQTFSGNITGNGHATLFSNVTVNGGKLVLSGANTYKGNTTIGSGGTLELGSTTALGTSTINLISGTLDFKGNAVSNTIADKAILNGTLTNTGAAVDLTGMGNFGATAPRSFTLSGTGNMTFGQAITGFYSINKTGSNTVTLSGANTYNGTTTITSGTVNLTGSLGNTTITLNGGTFKMGASSSLGATSTVIVNSGSFDTSALVGGFTVAVGQTIQGSGTYTGDVTVNGTLAPGNSPGVVTFTNNLTLSGTTVMEINGTARGTDYDGVNLTGSGANTLTYGGTLTLSFGAAITAGTYDLFNLGSVNQTGDFTSVGATGAGISLSGFSASIGTGWTANLAEASNNWILTFDNASGDLTITAIPEPSTYAVLAGFGTLGLAIIRRRRSA